MGHHGGEQVDVVHVLHGRDLSYASKLGDKSAGRSLALLFMVLREKAIKGDRRAIKTLQDFDAEYNQNAEPPPEGLSFLVVPEPCATMEEWKAMYSPKDGPPNIEGHED